MGLTTVADAVEVDAHPRCAQTARFSQTADQAAGGREVDVDNATAVLASKVMMGVQVAVIARSPPLTRDLTHLPLAYQYLQIAIDRGQGLARVFK